MPGIQESAKTGPYKAADPCHKDPARASARPACAGLKSDKPGPENRPTAPGA